MGKSPTTLVRRLISPLTRSRGLVDQILRQCPWRKLVTARTSAAASVIMTATSGSWLASMRSPRRADRAAAVALGEDRAHPGSDRSRRGLGNLGKRISHEVARGSRCEPTPKRRADRFVEPEVVIGDRERTPRSHRARSPCMPKVAEMTLGHAGCGGRLRGAALAVCDQTVTTGHGTGVFLVEVAGVEPASSETLSGLLRAQPVRRSRIAATHRQPVAIPT